MFAAAKPITIVQGLEDAETFNGGEALFECALSRPESRNCRWLLDGKPVKESASAEIVTFESGRRHLLLLKELSLKDSCTVTFEAGTASSSAKLSVKGEKAQPKNDKKIIGQKCRNGIKFRALCWWFSDTKHLFSISSYLKQFFTTKSHHPNGDEVKIRTQLHGCFYHTAATAGNIHISFSFA